MPTPTILLINKYYHDRGPAGGVGRYLIQEEEDLQAAGWRVVPFAMADEDVRPSRWERFFVRAHDYSRPAFSASAMASAFSLVWNREAARNLEALLQEVRPDVVHLHNAYHHLSPSILPVLGRHRLPVVMTLHDLRLLCPAIHMLRRGEICERCKGGHFIEAVKGRCVKDSLGASILSAIETAHQSRRRLYRKTVSRYLCPSAFYAEKFAQWGFPPERLVHMPNFVDLQEWRPVVSATEASYIYFGRISREKGLRTLLKAHARLESLRREAGLPIPRLRIAGSGPAAADLQTLSKTLNLEACDFLGPLSPDDLRLEIGRARFSVLPSEWYENGPLSLLESLAAGVPVVGARVGGIPEFISDGVDGLLFESGNPEDLSRALLQALALPESARAAARHRAETRHDRKMHMDRLQEIFRQVQNA